MTSGSDLFTVAGTGIGGVGAGATIAWMLLKRWMDDRDARVQTLDTRVTNLQDTTLAEIKSEMHDIKLNCALHQDKSAVARLEETVKSLQTSALKLDESARDLEKQVAGISERIDGVKSWVRDVSADGRKTADELHNHVANAGLHRRD